MQNNFSVLMDKALSATNGAICSLTLLTDVKVKVSCPIKNIKKLAVYNGIQFGTSYENGVTNALTRNGIDAEFKAEPMKGKVWYAYPRVEQSIKDANQYYVRFTRTKATKVTSCYIIDGRKATEAEVEVIKSYLYATSTSAKQTALGLADEEQKKPFSPKFESIVAWTVDKDCYYDSELVAESIKAIANTSLAEA